MKLELEKILMKLDTLNMEYLEESKNRIFNIIPELKNEDGFDQKSPWHIYDVWQHTEAALSNSNHDLEERLSLLLHDIGKPYSYQEENNIRHFKGHADKSAEITKIVLKRLKYDDEQINSICWLIQNHSTIIETKLINKENIGRMKKLLNIQYCDCKAYNPDKIESVLDRLNLIHSEIVKKEKSFEKEITGEDRE